MLRKADLKFVEIGPLVIHRGQGFGRVADQKGVGEVCEKIWIPQMVDVVRKILDENRALVRAGLEVLPDALQRQARRGFVPFRKSRPERILTLVPGLTERLVKAIEISALAHHPLKRGGGRAGYGPQGDYFVHADARKDDKRVPCSVSGAKPRVLKIRQ